MNTMSNCQRMMGSRAVSMSLHLGISDIGRERIATLTRRATEQIEEQEEQTFQNKSGQTHSCQRARANKHRVRSRSSSAWISRTAREQTPNCCRTICNSVRRRPVVIRSSWAAACSSWAAKSWAAARRWAQRLGSRVHSDYGYFASGGESRIVGRQQRKQERCNNGVGGRMERTTHVVRTGICIWVSFPHSFGKIESADGRNDESVSEFELFVQQPCGSETSLTVEALRKDQLTRSWVTPSPWNCSRPRMALCRCSTVLQSFAWARWVSATTVWLCFFLVWVRFYGFGYVVKGSASRRNSG